MADADEHREARRSAVKKSMGMEVEEDPAFAGLKAGIARRDKYTQDKEQGELASWSLNPLVQTYGDYKYLDATTGQYLEGETGISDPAMGMAALVTPLGIGLIRQGKKLFSMPEDQVKKAAENFNNWFGKSRVVDEAGAPLKVYHGSQAPDLKHFNTYTDYGAVGSGAYFTVDPRVASSYAASGEEKALRRQRAASGTQNPIDSYLGYNKPKQAPAANVTPVYLSIQNPIDMDAPADVNAWLKGLSGNDYHEDAVEEILNRAEHRERMKLGGLSNGEVRKIVEEGLMDMGVHKGEGEDMMRDLLQLDMGHDGITHLDNYRSATKTPHRVYVVFEPSQIKSTISNTGEFSSKPGAAITAGAAGAVGAGAAARSKREGEEQ